MTLEHVGREMKSSRFVVLYRGNILCTITSFSASQMLSSTSITLE